MELLNYKEIMSIVKPLGYNCAISWKLKDFSDTLLGYLGDHLTLIVEVECDGGQKQLKFFVKCVPRFDKWKAKYIKELTFFSKEYKMLDKLFKTFQEGTLKWRPTALLLREDLFVFEDVTELGYVMPNQRNTLTLDELKACVVTIANFHAESFILEENLSKHLKRPYRIWDDYKGYLKESEKGYNWRNAGRDAVIDYLKSYSKARTSPNFEHKVKSVVTALYDKAITLMKPSPVYRNVVIHRDLWANNLFFKKNVDGSIHALIVDFQTILYCPPMLDLSSFIYFNTVRKTRDENVEDFLRLYYKTLAERLHESDLFIEDIVSFETIRESYAESLPFALTQAGLIVPVTVLDVKTRERLFCNPETIFHVNEVSRSKEIIEIANCDEHYRFRVTDLLDEIVDRYICPIDNPSQVLLITKNLSIVL